MRGVVGEGKDNLLTLINDIGSKEISLQTASQTAKPPALVVFELDLDDVPAAKGELVRAVSTVVVESHNLESRTNEERGVRHGHVSIRSMQHLTGVHGRKQRLTSG